GRLCEVATLRCQGPTFRISRFGQECRNWRCWCGGQEQRFHPLPLGGSGKCTRQSPAYTQYSPCHQLSEGKRFAACTEPRATPPDRSGTPLLPNLGSAPAALSMPITSLHGFCLRTRLSGAEGYYVRVPLDGLRSSFVYELLETSNAGRTLTGGRRR